MISIKSDAQITIGQLLILLCLIGTITSPPVANIFIGLILIWSVIFEQLRVNLINFLKSRLGLTFLAFLATIIIAPIYTELSLAESLSSIWGWRKILLFPISAIYFSDSYKSRHRLRKIFFWLCVLAALVSFVIKLSFNQDGILLRNYVTQGLIFSICTTICLIQIIKNISLRNKFFYILLAIIFIGNIAFISIGRSGYIALLVMTSCCIIYLHETSIFKKVVLFSGGIILLFGVLLNVPQSRDRIELAYRETVTGMASPEATSIGLRITFWQNSIALIKEKPFFGFGTGGFKKAYENKVQNELGVAAIVTGDPHNQYLKILIEQGIVGLFFFLWLLKLLLTQKIYDSTQLLGRCVLFAWCVTSLANAHFSTFNEGQFIWIWLGIFLTQYKNTNQI